MNASRDLISFVSMPGGTEWLILAVIGLLVFGKRLPEVSRSLGRSVIEFKKGLRGVEDPHDDERAMKGSSDTQPPPAALP